MRAFDPPPPADGPGRRAAILGVGNELNGDDGAGVRVVRELGHKLPPRPDVLLIESGAAPENFTGVLRRFNPDTVVIVDAAEMGEPPGTIRWLDWQSSDGLSASTHTLPPSALATFLIESIGCRVVLLGVQPTSVGFGEPMSPAVEAAIGEAVQRLLDWLRGQRGENRPGPL